MYFGLFCSCNVCFVVFEFGVTELNSTFETTPCYCRATARSNSFKFGTVVARCLEQALLSSPFCSILSGIEHTKAQLELTIFNL